MPRSKELPKTPSTGLPRGMLAAFAFRNGALDEPTYIQILRESREVRERQTEEKRKRDAANAHKLATQFRRVKGDIIVPLTNVVGSVRLRATVHRRLMDDGYLGSGWVYDEEAGCIRCRRYRVTKDHPDYGVWFDVGALILGLSDGASYRVREPFDLTTLSLR